METRTPAVQALADVQGDPDLRHTALDQVGIKGLRHPVRVPGRDGDQPTVGTVSMYVSLSPEQRGTHMSRFLEILHGFQDALSLSALDALLRTTRHRLAAEAAYMEVTFPYFVRKRAPVSGVPSLLDYEVTLQGEHRGDRSRLSVRVLVPVTSLCPCSKGISDYGAHNQRSHVTVTATIDPPVWIEDLVDLVEEEASCPIYGLIKRPDEKYLTEHAYDNPKFVEDMVRDVAARLEADVRIQAYRVSAENFESIHNHSAYACLARDKRPPRGPTTDHAAFSPSPPP